MKLPIIIIILFLSWFASFSQELQWKSITQENKPWTRWWWEGSAVNPKDLTTNMEKYQKAGLGGLEITPIYGIFGEESKFIEFLSPKWIEMLSHTIKEGKRLNLGIDVANASGWPFGGRWITDENSSKYITHKVYQLKGGEKLTEPIKFIQEPILRIVGNQFYSFGEPSAMVSPIAEIPNTKNFDIKKLKDPITENKNLQALAIDQVRFEKPIPLQTLMAYSDKGEKIDLTAKVDKNGNLDWVAPDGNWSLYAIFQGYHGKMVERAGPGGEGYVIDHFSKNATDFFLKQWSQALDSQKVAGMRAFFNDSYEVDDAKGQSNYTPDLFEEFRKRRGYDLKEHFDKLFETKKETPNRVLSDYRETISELLLEKYTKVWADWAHQRKAIVRNQAHGSPANILDLYATVDIPEIEGTDIYRIKFASSVANTMGKKLTSSESATWENDHFLTSLNDAKKALDLFFLGGVNHVFYHGTAYSPPNEPFPGWMFYAATHFYPHNPFWDDFSKLNDYVARIQSFLQASKPDNDVLLYFPIYDKFSHKSRDLLDHFDGIRPEFANTDFEANAKTLYEKGFAFDYISDKQIQNLTNENAAIKSLGGNYQTIVLSNVQFIPIETFRKIITLAKNGATIICYKNLPNDINGLSKLSERQAEFNVLINSLSFQKTSFEGVQEAKIGLGRILISNDLEQVLDFAKIRKEENLVNNGLSFYRKKSDSKNLYFVANRSDKDFEGWLKLEVNAKSVGLYNPMNENLGYAKSRITADNKIEVYLKLNQNETILIETYKKTQKGKAFPNYEVAGNPVKIHENWTVNFTKGGPVLPSKTSTQNLVSWTELGDETHQNFSGTGIYSVELKVRSEELLNSSISGFILKFDKIHESARIKLNGKEITTLISPPFQVFIPKNLLKETNQLEVSVSNLMANRMAYMDKNKIQYRKFYNINFPARFKENRDENGLFTAKNWTPKPSGIIGEVRLIPVR